jgi:periplasmic copper chaperone A
MKHFQSALATAGLMLLINSAMAHQSTCGAITVAHAHASPTLGELKVGAVYFKGITNTGQKADQLLGARTKVAAKVEIHEMAMAGDVMKMRAVPNLPIPAGQTVSLAQGQHDGHHVMLMGLSKPLKAGDKFPITLKFKRAGACQVEVWVEAPKAEPEAGAHQH